MFGINSNEPLPEEVNESYAAWDSYMAHVWYSLLYFFGIKSNSTIIEIAPGSSNKLSLALAKIPFTGRLYIVEPNEKLAGILSSKYAELLPKANIAIIQDTLENSLNRLPQSADALISNHPLDDMLLAMDIDNISSSHLFSWAYDQLPNKTQTISDKWDQFISNPKKLDYGREYVFNVWDNALCKLEPDLLLLSQYPSFTLNNANLFELNTISSGILEKLREKHAHHSYSITIIQTILNSMKNYNHEHIGHNILNAHNWLAIKK